MSNPENTAICTIYLYIFVPFVYFPRQKQKLTFRKGRYICENSCENFKKWWRKGRRVKGTMSKDTAVISICQCQTNVCTKSPLLWTRWPVCLSATQAERSIRCVSLWTLQPDPSAAHSSTNPDPTVNQRQPLLIQSFLSQGWLTFLSVQLASCLCRSETDGNQRRSAGK